MYRNKKYGTTASRDLSTLKKEVNDSMVAMIFTYGILCTLYSLKENNELGMVVSIAGIIVSFILGCITLIKIKKDKNIVLLFKTVSIIILSFGFLLITNTVGEMICEFKDKSYVYISSILYILILISNIVVLKKNLKHPKKNNNSIQDNLNSKRYIVSIGCALAFGVITPIINRYSTQNTKGIIIMGIFIVVSYLLLMSSEYYLEEYLILRSDKNKV